MTGTLLPVPGLRAVDQNGVPMSGALLQFYLTGTTTPTPVYADAALTTPLSNPVVSDSAGEFPAMYVDPAITYRAQLYTSAMVLVKDVDPVAQPPIIGAGYITSTMLAAGAALANLGYTPVNKAGDTATNLLLSVTALQPNSAGYLGAPTNVQNANYTLLTGDAGKLIFTTAGGPWAWTIPPLSAGGWVSGTTIVFRNISAGGTVTITRGAGVTLRLAGSATSQDVALAQWGLATAIMEQADDWVIAGTGNLLSGAVLSTLGGETSAGGATVIVPGALAWTNIYGSGAGATNQQTVTLITTVIALDAIQTGSGTLHVIKNGVSAVVSGPVNVAAGDVVSWLMVNSSGVHAQSGSIDIENASDGGALLDTFTYTVTP